MSNLDDILDDFWDIEKLVPKKKNNIHAFSSKIHVSEHNIDENINSARSEKCALTMSYEKPSFETEEMFYIPDSPSLIKKVTIKRDIDRYDFYENFRKAALIYYDFNAPKCEFAKYYSYMPQYSQLTIEQKNYYFYWRSEVRRGNYIKSDYSYLYLYVYEIINLPDKILPEEGISILTRLWAAYRGALPKIDPYFAVWVQDYSLVHRVLLPRELISDFIYEVISVSDFPEFYLSKFEASKSLGTESMLLYLSDYDFRRGKFSGGETADFYRTHMIGAMQTLFGFIFADGVTIKSEEVSKIKRSAFPHSLATHAVKCRLEIEYIKLSGDGALRLSVTEAVRYTENKLRSIIGIKSRLGIKALSENYKLIIDNYFAPVIDREKRKNTVKITPEYERLYDAPKVELSASGADELERASWSTTALLVEDEIFKENIVSTAEKEEIITGMSEDYGLSSDDILRLSEILDTGTSDDSFAERINEAFADGLGDIILEFDGERYNVIADYREEIEKWLKIRK